MRTPEKWLAVAAIAELADIAEQNVKKAISKGRWHGADLMVRQVEIGRGGAGGMAPQVHVDSLPADLRTAWYARHGIALHEEVDPATGETRLIPEDAGRNDPKWDERSAVAQWRLNIIREAARLPKGTAARKAALETLAAREHAQPNGKMKRISRATLYSWLGAYDAGGFLGLMPDMRKDKGVAKTIVSTVWDGFFAGRVARADHQRIGVELTDYIRSLWASDAAGWRVICEQSTTRLIEVSRELRDLRFDRLPLGDLSDAAGAPTQFGVCSVSAYAVRAERQYKVVAIRNKDNARYQDTIAPTIRRDYSQLDPREIVVGDVHPMDIMVRRPNGRPAYPKAISWFDPATGEVHMTIVLLEENEGVRREHVAMSFDAMVAKWGLPKLLYLDNGSEYNDTNMLGGFTMLSNLAGVTVKENSRADDRVLASEEAVIRSLPYNAKGKPGIEGLFGNLEQVFFSGVPGWTAGDRMKKKTHAKGKDPIPFPGDMAEFMRVINVHLDHYHKRPSRETRQSPNERLRRHIEAGWGKTVLGNPEDLALAFSSEITRVPDRGCISYAPRDGGSQRYYLDDLLGLLPGTPVTVRVPAYDPQFLFVFDEAGNPLGLARPEQMFDPIDKAGAAEGGRRAKFLRRKIAEQSRHCALLDLTEEVKRHLGHLPEAPEAPVAAVVSSEMLTRMREVEAEDRARLAAPETTPKRAPNQWGSGPNEALSNAKFEGEGE
ncbi:MAG: hypothetical protein ACK5LJ_08820 [Paracoccus sp. (in: a-proteobacteria)]